jgi:sugar O-acyltransferase (sialic acid O-acetyltransferase NeuD family)
MADIARHQGELGPRPKLADDFLWHPDLWPDNSDFLVAVGDPYVRERMATRALKAGHHMVSHNGGDYDPPKPLMPGVVIMKNATLTCDITIGIGVYINICAMIGHDCILEDWCSVQPNANLSGCKIGKYAYIGMGANIVAAKKGEPMRTIGEGAIVGAGAVVTKDVPAGETWVGNPARRIK